jgi:hypothetical protein
MNRVRIAAIALFGIIAMTGLAAAQTIARPGGVSSPVYYFTSHAPDTVTMQRLRTSLYPHGIWRDDFAQGYGAPPQFYQPSKIACSLNGGAGDKGSQIQAPDGCWLAQYSGSTADPREWGAVGNGTTDDTAALDAAASALANTGVSLSIVRSYYSATGVVFPPNSTVSTAALLSNPPGSPEIKCPVTSAIVCVTMQGHSVAGGSLLPTGVNGLIVLGVGTPVAGATGIEWDEGYAPWATNVQVSNFDTCGLWHAANLGGIHFIGVNIHLSQCKSHYATFDGWPEARFIGGRWGEDGSGDYAGASDFVYFENDSCNSSGCGPNTIDFVHTHFNPGNGQAPGCFFRWGNWNGEGVVSEFRFDGVHAETNSGSLPTYFCSDSTITELSVLDVADSVIEDTRGSTPVFALDAATQLTESNFSQIDFAGNSSVTLGAGSTHAAVNQVNFSDISNVATWALTSSGAGSNYLTVTNSTIPSLSIGGAWVNLGINGTSIGSVATDTATGPVYITGYPWTAFTPNLTFDGGSTGLTYATQAGAYRRSPGGGFEERISIALSALGSSTGSALISGTSAVTCARGDDPQYILAGYSGFTGLTTPPSLGVDFNSSDITPYTMGGVSGSGTSGGAMQTANFTNNTMFFGTAYCGQAN